MIKTDTPRLLFEIIKSEICESAPSLKINESEICELYRLSVMHDLAHVVGDALINNGMLSSDSEIYEKFKKQIEIAKYRKTLQSYELSRIKSAFDNGDIPYIVLKGSIISVFYPNEWLRTSCDIDILVHENDMERAKKALSAYPEYVFEKVRTKSDVPIAIGDSVELELHHSLTLLDAPFEAPLSLVWNSAKQIGKCEYALSDEMFSYYFFAHIAKHIYNGGCGLKPFIDLCVLFKNGKCGVSLCKKLLSENGLLRFAEACENITKWWFCGEELDSVAMDLLKYNLRSGVYGNSENTNSVNQVKAGGKTKYLLSRIFLPYSAMCGKYPVLKDKKWLLPYYEIKRILCFPFRMDSVNNAKNNINLSSERANSVAKLLSDLELK